MSRQGKNHGGTAVWFFVAATFAAILPVVLPSPEPGHWTILAGTGLALLLLVLGGIVLGRELRQRRESTD